MDNKDEFDAIQFAIAFLEFCERRSLNVDAIIDRAKDALVESRR